MRTIKTTLYKFDELSETAKEKARQWYREASASDEPDYVLDDVVQVAELMGIEIGMRNSVSPRIYYCAGHVQGDYAAFEGSYRYRKGAAKAVRDYAPQDAELHRIADTLQAIQARNFYQLTASAYVQRDWQGVEVDRYDGLTMTEDAEEAVTEAMRDFAHWVYKQILAEFDYRSSDEVVDESITANEYEFTEDGGIA